eukprot:CAMPEP_0172512012 /NCGR_PEP_ID=MMETSP1066-20121228/240972_1 /TAXON_ID=671091 /ORGANISM="Coscinodiscus wailesii, Strain CCMP2513" /LENGTH=399 /DNA_ID=CAMNT_0013291623 /DNA_START=267 /DNA_END=1463 /DNA_ORIENTATION=-
MHLIHGKGIITLLLISLSEGISVANAVAFYTTEHHKSHSHKKTDDARTTAGGGTTEDASCPSSSAKPPTRTCPLPFFSRRVTNKSLTVRQCFRDCCDRLPDGGDSALAICETIARGGSLSPGDGLAHDAASGAGATTSGLSTTPYDVPLYAWKIIFQFFLTSINVICWLVPLKSKRISENKLALSIANAFSGGVFLTLAFGHLLPECVHGFHGYNEALPYMVVLGGYLLIFFVEKVAFDTHALLEAGHGHHDHGHEDKNGVVDNVDGGQEGGVSSGRSAVILLGALAVHSVLEMTALGLANTFGDSALLSLSIALHQPAESIALLVAFLKSNMSHSQIITYLSIFSTMGPVGVAIGMAVKNFAAPIVDAVMLAVVAGTFIYVGATEVIPEEWEDGEHKW